MATLEWPPAADDLAAIVFVDLRATSGVVCEPRDLLYRKPAARPPSPPASGIGVGDGLRWPPSESDLDGITAWSVRDGAPRPPVPPRRRAMGWTGMAVTGVVAVAAVVAVAQLPARPPVVAPSAERIAARQPLIATNLPVLSVTRDASPLVTTLPVRASEARRSEPPLPRAPAAGPAVPSRPAARPETVALPAASRLAKAGLTPTPAPVVTPRVTPREAGEIITERVPNGRLTSEPPPGPPVPALVASTELTGRVPELLSAPVAAPTLPALIATPPASTGLARPESAPVRNLDEPRIKGVLSRYGAAYSRLDAGAARDVWPTVDARALSRAFESLRSQEVVLGACEIAIDGDRAEAACRGTSTYVPRVGDPTPRRESRQWRFQLARTDETAWHIRSAESR